MGIGAALIACLPSAIQSNDGWVFAEEAEKKSAASENERSDGHRSGPESTSAKKDAPSAGSETPTLDLASAVPLAVAAVALFGLVVMLVVSWTGSGAPSESEGKILSSRKNSEQGMQTYDLTLHSSTGDVSRCVARSLSF